MMLERLEAECRRQVDLAGLGKPDLHYVVRLLEEFTAGQLKFPS